MTTNKAWDVINKMVGPRVKELGIKMPFPYGTIMSSLDWDNGVALHTPKGDIHVLGDGQIVDPDNVLKYQ